MKHTYIVLLIAAVFSWSCSSDKDKSPQEPDSITGTWEARELKINDDTASDDEKNGRDLLNYLTAKDCYILVLTFNEDLSLITENSLNYLEINMDGSGYDIPCPTEKDMDVSTYTYDGKVLTFVDEDSQTVTLNVTVTGDTMAVEAADLDIAELNSGGQLIFQKR